MVLPLQKPFRRGGKEHKNKYDEGKGTQKYSIYIASLHLFLWYIKRTFFFFYLFYKKKGFDLKEGKRACKKFLFCFVQVWDGVVVWWELVNLPRLSRVTCHVKATTILLILISFATNLVAVFLKQIYTITTKLRNLLGL